MSQNGIAAFRSRQQVMYYEGVFGREGVPVRVISTPRGVSAGCGLSLQFPMEHLAQVQSIVRRYRPSNLIGLYQVETVDGRQRLSALTK